MSDQADISRAIQGLRSRLDTLASINEANILIPGGPQEHDHQLVEEAYVVLGLIETEVDALRQELEYQHQRLDSARDTALTGAIQEKRVIDTSEQEARTTITEWAKSYFAKSDEHAMPEVEMVTIGYYEGENEWTVELEVSTSANNPYVRFSISDEPGHGLQIIGVKY